MDGPIAEGTAQKKYLIQIIQIGRLIANRMVWYDNFLSMIWTIWVDWILQRDV